jgi:hypothetical protein
MRLLCRIGWFGCLCASHVAGADTPLASLYPNDAGILNDPAVLFADNFESGDLKKWDQVRDSATVVTNEPQAGRHCVRAEMVRGKNTGGDAIKWFLPGADRVFVRCYVKFSADYQYAHHFIWLSGNPPRDKWRSFGRAGRNRTAHISPLAWSRGSPGAGMRRRAN